MSFDHRRRQVGNLTLSHSAVATLDMPRKHLLRNVWLRLLGSNVISTAGSPVLKTGSAVGSAFEHIQRIELIANGRDTIKSIPGTALAMKNLFLKGQAPIETESGISAATHPFGGTLCLPLGMPRSIRPLDTYLPTGKLSTLELRVTFGAVDSMFTTAPTTYAITGTVSVEIDESIRLDGKDEAFSTYKELFIERTVTAASSAFQILLPVGNRFRGLMIETVSDGNYVDTILNKATVKSGTDVFFSADEDALQEANEVTFRTKGEATTGYYYIDFCPEGRLVDALDATKLSQLELELDVNAPGTTDVVRVYPDEIITGAIR